MRERVKKLRTRSIEAVPSISIERAQIVTDAYKKYFGKVSTPILRALTLKEICERKTLYIGEDELIVGERGPAPKATATYPEICCHTLEDLRVMDSREKTCFKVSPEVYDIQEKEIIPYWSGKSMREKILGNMTSEWLDCYYAGLFTEFMEQRGPGHTVGDKKLFNRGFIEVIEEIDMELIALDFINDADALDKSEELKAMKIAAESVMIFARRHGDLAKELSEQEENPKRKAELLKMAEVCYRVPAHKPETLWEAIQGYWFIHLTIITEMNIWDAFSPGRFDQHIYPIYKKDLEAGLITREDAEELLQCLWCKFNNQPSTPKVGVTLKESGTYTDFATINIGGLNEEGFDGVNEMSYLLLDVVDSMTLLQPNSNIQLSRKNPEGFIKRGAEVIRKGWGQPPVFNADSVFQELVRQGKSVDDARQGGTSGCVETGAFGKEAYILTGYFNLVKILEITLNNGRDPITGKHLGIESGDPRNFVSFDELFQAYKKQIHHFVDIKVRGSNVIEKLYMTEMPGPFLSTVIDDCIKKGKDYNAGGARYNSNYIQGVGIGTLTDSLSSIKYHVYEKNRISMDELLNALKNNFQGNEPLRQILLNKTSKYGNDNDYADEIMKMCFDAYYNEVNGRKTVRGGEYRINMLPTTCHIYFGEVTGATADGRLNGTPQSEGISPAMGADKFGPTAVIKSAAKMDHLRTGGTLLNQKFTPSILQGEEGINNLCHLIRAYFNMDGHHIQFNVVKAETLKKAQENPEQYKDLIVRVAGYSDYFCDLGKILQDEIINRTEHEGF
jgi:pyruvate formate-lyase/glycerol dehydratase family glycyl radical enzyme